MVISLSQIYIQHNCVIIWESNYVVICCVVIFTYLSLHVYSLCACPALVNPCFFCQLEISTGSQFHWLELFLASDVTEKLVSDWPSYLPIARPFTCHLCSPPNSSSFQISSPTRAHHCCNASVLNQIFPPSWIIPLRHWTQRLASPTVSIVIVCRVKSFSFSCMYLCLLYSMYLSSW